MEGPKRRPRLSRRSFLAASSGAFAAPLLPAKAEAPGPRALREEVDLAAFRPRPRVRILAAVVRYKPPYWLSWPGTAYDVEGRRREYARLFAEIGRRTGVDVELRDPPIEDAQAVEAFIAEARGRAPDALLLSLQHIGVWDWVDAIARAGIPTIVFSPVGMAFTFHVREISRRPGIHVVSSLQAPALEQAFRMVRAKRQLEETRLLVVAGEARNETVLERLGMKIRRIPRSALHERFEKIPAGDEARAIAEAMRAAASRIVEPTADDLLNAARSFIAARELLREESSNGITTDCLGMVSARVVPTPPCMAASLFQDAGIVYGCEADLFAAVSLAFVSYRFDKPGFMQDPVPETHKNLLIGAHCACGTRLAGFGSSPEPLILRSHSESNLGVSTQVIWKPGQRVTLVSFQDPNRLILDSGAVVGNVDTPPAGGCRTSVEIAMDRIEDARDVLGFHQVIFYGDHRRDVEAFCQMYGIQIIRSPERAPGKEEA